MSASDPAGRPGQSNRASLVRKLALALAFLLALAGTSIWVVRAFVLQPGKSVILPPEVLANVSSSASTAAPRPRRPTNANRPTFTGKVTDARTHDPIANFTVSLGYGYGGDQPPQYQEPSKSFTGGQYKMTSRRTGAFDAWYVRITAPGHLPQTSPPLRTVTNADFELQPGKDLQGRVLAADGTPLPGIEVVVAIPGQEVYLVNGKPVDRGNARTVSAADGTYDLPPQGDKYTVVAVGDAGFVNADQAALAKSADLHLAAWGSVKGRLLIGTKPAVTKDISVQTSNQNRFFDPYGANVYNSYRARTDADGQFKFDHVQPGPIQVGRLVMQRFGQTNMGSYSTGRALTLKPGETQTINLGGEGRSVIGKLVLPNGMDNPQNQSYYLIIYVTGHADIKPPQMPDKIKNGTPDARQLWMKIFLMTPAGREYAQAHPEILTGDRRMALELTADHNFRIDDVTPGNYEIDIQLQSMRGGNTPQPVRSLFTMPPIPGGVSDDPLTIPDIVIKS